MDTELSVEVTRLVDTSASGRDTSVSSRDKVQTQSRWEPTSVLYSEGGDSQAVLLTLSSGQSYPHTTSSEQGPDGGLMSLCRRERDIPELTVTKEWKSRVSSVLWQLKWLKMMLQQHYHPTHGVRSFIRKIRVTQEWQSSQCTMKGVILAYLCQEVQTCSHTNKDITVAD